MAPFKGCHLCTFLHPCTDRAMTQAQTERRLWSETADPSHSPKPVLRLPCLEHRLSPNGGFICPQLSPSPAPQPPLVQDVRHMSEASGESPQSPPQEGRCWPLRIHGLPNSSTFRKGSPALSSPTPALTLDPFLCDFLFVWGLGTRTVVGVVLRNN